MQKKHSLVFVIPTKFETMIAARELNIPENSLQNSRLIQLKPKKFLIISGVGAKSKNVLNIILKKITDPQIVLIGFCGCSDKNVPIGTVFAIEKTIHDGETIDTSTENEHYMELCMELPKSSITTIDSYGTGNLVDMDSFWFAKACKTMNIRLNIIRIVSDHCDMDPKVARQIFRFKEKNIPENFVMAQKKLSEHIKTFL